MSIVIGLYTVEVSHAGYFDSSPSQLPTPVVLHPARQPATAGVMVSNSMISHLGVFKPELARHRFN